MQVKAYTCSSPPPLLHLQLSPPPLLHPTLTSEELQVLFAAIQSKVHGTGGEDTGCKLPACDVQSAEVQQLQTHTEHRG